MSTGRRLLATSGVNLGRFQAIAGKVTGLVEEYTGRPQIVIGLPVQVKVIAAFLAELSGLPTVVALGRRNSCS